MSNTLRRKMFKLGGEVNTHGVGITSGLEYRRPGYNAGGPVIKPGPDGQLRQHVFLGGILSGTKNILNALNTARKSKSLEAITKYIKGKGTGELIDKPAAGSLMRTDVADDALRAFTKMDRLGQVGRGAGITGTVAAPFGLASGLAPRMSEEQYKDKNISDARKNFDRVRGLTELLTDLNPALGVGSIAGSALDAGARSFGLDPDYSLETVPGLLRKTIYGSDKDSSIGSTSVPKGRIMEVAETQEEQFAKMKDDANTRAELYYNLMSDGGPNKTRALAAGLTNFGNLYDEDKVAAISGFSEGVGQELDRQSDIKSTAMQAAIGDVITGETQRKQMVEQAKLAIMSSPDLTAAQRSSSIKGLEAFEQGVVDLLPTNDKGDEINLTGLAPGTIYLDITGLTDGTYVAVSSQDTEDQVDSFNSISEARAHAAS